MYANMKRIKRHIIKLSIFGENQLQNTLLMIGIIFSLSVAKLRSHPESLCVD